MDWRDYFAIKTRNYPKVYQAPSDAKCMLLLKMVEACRDEAWVAAGGPSYPEAGPAEDHPCIAASKAIDYQDILKDHEKMHFIQGVMDRVYGVPA